MRKGVKRWIRSLRLQSLRFWLHLLKGGFLHNFFQKVVPKTFSQL